MDFSNSDMSGQNLQGHSFEHDLCENTNFTGANLSKANFSHATLTGANFTGANLSGAYLTYADMERAIFQGANLRGAKFGTGEIVFLDIDIGSNRWINLFRNNMRGTNFVGADLSGAVFTNVVLSPSDTPTDFTGADLGPLEEHEIPLFPIISLRTAGRPKQGAVHFHYSVLNHCIFRGADLHYASIHENECNHADFYGANLGNADLSRSHFIEADFTGASLVDADVDGSVFTGADVRTASYTDLSGAIDLVL